MLVSSTFRVMEARLRKRLFEHGLEQRDIIKTHNILRKNIIVKSLIAQQQHRRE